MQKHQSVREMKFEEDPYDQPKQRRSDTDQNVEQKLRQELKNTKIFLNMCIHDLRNPVN